MEPKYPEESSGIFRLANFNVDLNPLFKNELFSKGLLTITRRRVL